jgi:NAD(P)-dependent dehydrogenase (short-subunit alcohol dehydrogenase family)
MMRLQGKKALVTGAGRGLGRAIAERYAREGAVVAVVSRHRTELEDLTQGIESEGGQGLPLVGDVSRPDDLQWIASEISQNLNTVDVLVNNAAVIGPSEFLEDPQSWHQTLDINLLGAARCIQEVLPLMPDPYQGTVINISSGLARMGFPRFSAYCASKAGLEQLSRCLAEEFGPQGLRVACLDPGVMDTSMQEDIRSRGPERLGSKLWEQFTGLKDQHQLRDPEEVAELALALAVHIPEGRNGTTFSMKDLSVL